ncbi:MAG: CocE/NonD family hydrolase, partial [Planctomycetaceae bacterium]|nr:CocE/NonD family hydrolase [Planctomycetaceae bacterium]
QPWYDGRLGMWGVSYYGYTQWVLADQKNPGPTALIIQESSSDMHGMFYPGGAFSLRTALYWAAMSYGRTDIIPAPEAMRRGVTVFPLITADDRAVQDIPFFNDWASHTDRDDYWANIDGANRPGRVQAPVLLMGGWYDPFLPTQLADYARIRESAAPDVAQETRLVIGPWVHAAAAILPDGTEPRNFRLECLAPTVAWFDRHLQHKQSTLAPVRIYTIGTNQWRDEQEWPLARTRYTPYYLQSNGPANTASGKGILTTSRPPHGQPADSFTYDPHDPVPTAGGAMLGSDAGAAPQFAVEARDDVLVYSTEPLTDDLEVTGPIKLILHVATTALCTDFTGKLVNVFPDGSAWNVSEGILRRNFTQPSNAGNTEITIDMWPTSTVFKKGHRLRLEVSSSNYPRFDRNPNTGKQIAKETEPVSATQTVFHDAEATSRLILPIIPEARK